MSRLAVCALLLALFASSASAQVRALKYTISVEPRGEAPKNVYLDRDGAAPIKLSLTEGLYKVEVGALPRGNEATLRAVYNDDSETSLRIRLLAFSPEVSTVFFRLPPTSCVNGVVQPLELPASEYRQILESYFKARDLALGRATTPCGSTMRKRVAWAWFNKSYSLATRVEQIAFDQDSAENLRRVDPSSGPQIAKALKQIEGRKYALDYRTQKWAIDKGDYGLALAVNGDLQARVQVGGANGEAANLQGLYASMLAADAKFLLGKAGTIQQVAVKSPQSSSSEWEVDASGEIAPAVMHAGNLITFEPGKMGSVVVTYRVTGYGDQTMYIAKSGRLVATTKMSFDPKQILTAEELFAKTLETEGAAAPANPK